MRQQYALLACAIIGLVAVGCEDSGSPTPPPPEIPPAVLEIVSGNGQTGAADRPLASPLRVRVLGSENQPVVGAVVQWSVTQGQAALDPEQSITDANGEGQTEVSLGTAIGTTAVSATVGDLPPVIFSISVLGSSDFIAVSAGADHTCGLAPTGEVYCWGSNAFGKLGDGTTTDRLRPTLVLGGLSFSSISAGAEHTCGLTTDETAYCWGENSSGRLGDGTTNAQLVPVPVAGERRYSVISAANLHTCAITTAGAAFCWGQNSFGQLGIGTTNGPEECSIATEATPCSTVPVGVTGGRTYTGIGVGSAHTCAVTAD